MNGDFTRFPVGRVADSLYPLQQQGRVHLDADWNELAATLTDNVRLSIDSLLGGSAAVDPGFRPDGPPDETLGFAPGTYFVEGYRVVAPARVGLGEQPFQPPGDAELPADTPDAHNILFYLDVWVRHVTARARPDLAEVALRGPDTTTRGILTWQIRATRVPEQTATEVRQGWSAIVNRIRPDDRAMLRARVELAETLEPCLDDVVGGYTGPQNQLYRFEVAPAPVGDGADVGKRVILWSKDNASVESRIRSRSGDSVELISDPTSPALLQGALVQIVDDTVELGGAPNRPIRIAAADVDEDRVTLAAGNGGTDLSTDDATTTHARLRHWDGILDLVEGEQEVEHGVRIELKGAEGALVGDYWVVPARTNGALLWPDDRRWPARWPVDWPDDFRPPHGADHLFAPLALIVGTTVLDARWIVASMRGDAVLTLTPQAVSPTPNKWENTATGIRKVATALSDAADGTMDIALPDGVRLEQLTVSGSRTSGTLNIRLRREPLGGGGPLEQIALAEVTPTGRFDVPAPANPALSLVDTDTFRYVIRFNLSGASVDDVTTVDEVRVAYRRS